MRGIMGVDMNRINKYTLGKNTQGLSNYLHQSFPNKGIKVAIAHDCRNNSRRFAKIVADVFAANGIRAFLFSDLRPILEFSSSMCCLGCQAGVVSTASHNPPEYNGYKVYWKNGRQTVPPRDGEIMKAIDTVDFKDIKFSADESLIHHIDRELDNTFAETFIKHVDFRVTHKENLRIVFTPLHSTSITMVPGVFRRIDYTSMHTVKEQAVPDGNFPIVESPNSEEPEALAITPRKANEFNVGIVIGTDPDCDRIDIAVRDLNGKVVLLSGDRIMVMMTDFFLAHQSKGGFKGNEFVASAIVFVPTVEAIADVYKVKYKEGLTGFKWIAKMIEDSPGLTFIGGGEESFGYIVGGSVHDKDTVIVTLLACEMAANAKVKGSTFYKELLHTYTKYGFYKEYLISLVKKGISGSQEVAQMMTDLRENPPKEINGERVTLIYNYQSSKVLRPPTGKVEEIEVPESNVLIYHTDKGTRIVAHLSGTEPKIKFCFSANTTLSGSVAFEGTQKVLDGRIKEVVGELKLQ